MRCDIVRTKITELLGIRHPVLMGGMQWVSVAEFVAAVADAGGLAFLTAATFNDGDELKAEIEKCRSLTANPFGVNISMLPELAAGDKTLEFARAAAESGIRVVETSGRDPSAIIGELKKAEVKVIHKVTSPRHAASAQKAGADAVVLVGYEGAGHPGMEQVGTFVNLPATVSAVTVPVIAAGGVCDGISMAAALALGAEGVMMGTRFIATTECPVHDRYKRWILDSGTADTIIIQKTIRNALRAMRNERALLVLGMEQNGVALRDLLPHISGLRGKAAMQSGDLNDAVLPAGQCAGRIDSLIGVGELIAGIVRDAEQRIDRLAGEFGRACV